MLKKLSLIAAIVLTAGFSFAPRTRAGTEMIEPQQAPAPRYNYAPAPQPEVVYYAPPPLSVVVYPPFGYYRPRYRSFGYHRFYGHRGYAGGGHHWR